MTPHEFMKKWRHVELKERSASQSHFNDLCALLGVIDPVSADPTGEWFTFEKGASKTSGGEGWADVWRSSSFAWEYKGRHANLDKAYSQLLQYSVALENPPLLIVSDMNRIIVRTNWTNTVQEKHEFALDDLVDGAVRDKLKSAFLDPEVFKPKKSRQKLTEETAGDFAGLAQRLRDRGHEAHQVAHFINRLIFCMFAEDVGLLPDNLFTKMLDVSRKSPEEFGNNAQTLFGAMAKQGGKVGFTSIEWFNGGLFEDEFALPVTSEDIGQLVQAAGRDWSQIDPSILGTLFERGLDPAKRSQLGAHYTDFDKIMTIIRPTIIEPLEAIWSDTLLRMTGLVEQAPLQTKEKLLRGAELGKRTRALAEAASLHNAYVEKLANFRVLDPACGSGNFLYVALKSLKDIEHRANLDAETLGLPRGFPRVGPESMLGIELNPYAAELARVSVWIGEIQWMRRNGFDAAKNPILKPLDTIECRDAILSDDNGWAPWPEADAIIGNPPFLGAKWMLERLGEDYTQRMRHLLPSGTPASDLVTFWFAQAAKAVEKRTRHVGFVATNMVRSPSNSKVAEFLYKKTPITFALSDEPWVVDGADLRVSLIVCSSIDGRTPILDEKPVASITSNLKSLPIDIRSSAILTSNRKRAVRGVEKGGPFEIDGTLARKLLLRPVNPNGLSNFDVIKRYTTVSDIVGRGKNEWIIDFTGHSQSDASFFEGPFAHIESIILSARTGNRDPKQLKNWWLFRRSGEQAKKLLDGKERILATGLVTKHRVFRWIDTNMIPDTRVILIDTQADAVFGILSSRIHEVWSLATCQFHGVGNDPVYTPSDCFETFPFPDCIPADISQEEAAANPTSLSVALASERLNSLRENWLNPSDLVKQENEVLSAYPDRIVPKDINSAKELKTRTMTQLYNSRPQWLTNVHGKLDQAVAEAYGWGTDWQEGAMTNEEILTRLFHLNQKRAAKG